uniref:Uncharacterized protein n=1 Tax=viral metagenome TaxID=1070528 RepID=A0A6C0C9B9_9ZZZZ
MNTLEKRIRALPSDIRRILFTYFTIKSRNEGDMEIIGYIFSNVPMRIFLLAKIVRDFWILDQFKFNIDNNFVVTKSESKIFDDHIFMEIRTTESLQIFTDAVLSHKLNDSTCRIEMRRFAYHMIMSSQKNDMIMRTKLYTGIFDRFGIETQSDTNINININMLHKILQTNPKVVLMYITNDAMYVQCDNLIDGGTIKDLGLSITYQYEPEINYNHYVRIFNTMEIGELFKKIDVHDKMRLEVISGELTFIKITDAPSLGKIFSMSWSKIIIHLIDRISCISITTNYGYPLRIDITFNDSRMNTLVCVDPQ